MMTHNNINKICVVVTIFALVLTILFMNGKRLGLQSVVDEDTDAYEDSQYFTTNDQRADWDESDATTITLNGDSCKISGNGAYWNDGKVVITGGGYYVISGELNDGSIVVDAYESSKVFMKLSGVNINCSDDACFRVNQADKVFITLAEGTENTFESGEEYSDEALEDGTGGVVFAHDDLAINGSGSLTVTANYKHGIDANDDLIIAGGKITINAVKDGIHVNDSVRIKDSDITIDAQDDGIVTTKEDSYVYIESGTINITSSDDGIHSAGNVLANGGELSITAGDDGIHSDVNVTVADGYINITQCYEGIEALTIDVTGGEIEIYPADDGFNANGGSGDMFGNMGGNFGGNMGGGFDRNMGNRNWQNDESSGTNNAANDKESTDNIETGEDSNNAGDVSITESTDISNEQIEKQEFDIRNEDSTLNSDTNSQNSQMNHDENMQPLDMSNMNGTTDNASSGDSTSDDSDEDEETYINISGGKITIINETGKDADGLDSNGSIYISGGEIYVSLSGNGTNNAIDYGSENNGICEINGGTIIACGGSGMVEEISSTSTQASIMYNLSTAAEAKTSVKLISSDGRELLSYEVPCSYSSVVVSTPEMKQDETYTLTMGDTEEEITLDSVAGTYGTAVNSMGGMMGGGMRGGMQMNINDSNATDLQNDNNTDSGSSSDTQTMRGPGGTPPNMDDGNMPDMNNFTPPDMNGNTESDSSFEGVNESTDPTESTEDDVKAYSSQKEVTSDEWIWLGGSLGVLILGILVATAYKKW